MSKVNATTAKKNNWSVILVYIVLVFLLQEVVFRICFPLPELQNFNRITYQILDPIANGPGFLRNIKMSWNSSPDTAAPFIHHFNTYGFRDKEWEIEKKQDQQRILFVGDSFVEGMMADQDKTITETFKKLAKQAGKNYDIFNCGMMGIGLNEYIKFIADAVPIFKPDHLFLVLYSNDIPFQRPYQPSTIIQPKKYTIYQPRLLALMAHAKNNQPIPFRWSSAVKPYHKAVPDPSNPWTTKEQEWSAFVTPAIKKAMQAGTFNFFRMNWILQEERFLKSQPDISSKLSFIKNYLNKYDCGLTAFYIPSRSQVSDYYYQFEKQACLINCPEQLSLQSEPYQLHRRTLVNECKKLDIPFFDLTDIVKKEEDNGNHLYWNYDDHMRGKGYQLLGKNIYKLHTSSK